MSAHGSTAPGRRGHGWSKPHPRAGGKPSASRAAFAAGLAFILVSATTPAAAQCYRIGDLGAPPGASDIRARDINNVGQAVGCVFTTSYHAFLYQDGLMIDLGALEGSESFAHGINDSGQVVGSAQTASGDHHAFLYQNNTMIDLGTLGGTYSFAAAINNAGQVAGYSGNQSGECHAFVWHNGVMTDLGAIGTWGCQVWDINNSGQVVGVMQPAEGRLHAFIWSMAEGIIDLGTLGGMESYPYRINDAGQIVGGTWTGEVNPPDNPVTHAFLYRAGGITHPGTLGGENSVALGINSAGQVVGAAETDTGELHAFVYDHIRGMQDLNTLISPSAGWSVLQKAAAINDAGQIVGTGLINDQQHLFILTPDNTDADANGIPDACEALPQPSTCGEGLAPMLTLTLLGLAWIKGPKKG